MPKDARWEENARTMNPFRVGPTSHLFSTSPLPHLAPAACLAPVAGSQQDPAGWQVGTREGDPLMHLQGMGRLPFPGEVPLSLGSVICILLRIVALICFYFLKLFTMELRKKNQK